MHRLNSRWPVNVYPIICERSIDRKLEALIQEKGDAAELVLDGHLIGEQTSEVNLAELLEVARKEFDADQASGTWVDEAELEKEWPALRVQIAEASRTWRLRGLDLFGASLESRGAHRSHSSLSSPAPVVAAIESNALFAGLPLFDLAGT